MLERMFPSDVIVVEAAEASEAAELHPEEAAQLGRVSEQRRHEFAAGRACARLALERLGLPAAAPLLSRPDRSPAWPEGAVAAACPCNRTPDRCAGRRGRGTWGATKSRSRSRRAMSCAPS